MPAREHCQKVRRLIRALTTKAVSNVNAVQASGNRRNVNYQGDNEKRVGKVGCIFYDSLLTWICLTRGWYSL
jgi:hypothetical protein